MSEHRLNRRRFLTGTGMLAAGSALTSLTGRAEAQSSAGSSNQSSAAADGKSSLSFNNNGRFRIVQFNDTQDNHLTDHRTLDFMAQVCDKEQPDFVVINGDVITGGPTTNREVYQAINNVVLPMESRKIPWAVTFGNHDEDSTEEDGTTVFEPEMVDFIRQYSWNLNPGNDPSIHGDSDAQLLIESSTGNGPAFAIWLLDSGRYAPDSLSEQSTDPLPAYDWIRPPQIRWYEELSRATEERFGHKVPGLMFFHIPTYEHRDMWFGGPYESADSAHSEAAKRHGIDGEKNESVYVGAFNSGIFTAALERGDIAGIYCGHDHINTYKGDYLGIELGYGPGTGFAPYGLHDGT